MDQIESWPRILFRSLWASVAAGCIGAVASPLLLGPAFLFLFPLGASVFTTIIFVFGFLPLLAICRREDPFLRSGQMILWGCLSGLLAGGIFLVLIFLEYFAALLGLAALFAFCFFVLLPFCRKKGTFLHSRKAQVWGVRIGILVAGGTVFGSVAVHLGLSQLWPNAGFLFMLGFPLNGALNGLLAAALFQKFGGSHAEVGSGG